MGIVGTQVHQEFGEAPGYTVRFQGEDRLLVSVKFCAGNDLHRLNAVLKARAIMLQIASFKAAPESAGYAHEYETQSNRDLDDDPTVPLQPVKPLLQMASVASKRAPSDFYGCASQEFFAAPDVAPSIVSSSLDRRPAGERQSQR